LPLRSDRELFSLAGLRLAILCLGGGRRGTDSRNEKALLFGTEPAAAELTLIAKELRRIEEIAPRGVASGLRYPEEMMRLVNL